VRAEDDEPRRHQEGAGGHAVEVHRGRTGPIGQRARLPRRQAARRDVDRHGSLVDNQDGTYGVTADWWGVETTKGVSEEEFQNQLAQKYQYHNVKQACEEKGYAVEEEVNEEDGSIRLVVRKWVSE
jgi:hypothetical protein